MDAKNFYGVGTRSFSMQRKSVAKQVRVYRAVFLRTIIINLFLHVFELRLRIKRRTLHAVAAAAATAAAAVAILAPMLPLAPFFLVG